MKTYKTFKLALGLSIIFSFYTANIYAVDACQALAHTLWIGNNVTLEPTLDHVPNQIIGVTLYIDSLEPATNATDSDIVAYHVHGSLNQVALDPTPSWCIVYKSDGSMKWVGFYRGPRGFDSIMPNAIGINSTTMEVSQLGFWWNFIVDGSNHSYWNLQTVILHKQ